MTNATVGAMMGNQVQLYHFKPPEFNRGGTNWYSDMSPRLLVLLDVYRTMWGLPVSISGHNKAVGRCLGRDNTTQHNIERWGEVRAVDCFPSGMEPTSVADAVQLADEIGFTGIGLYPQWRNNKGEVQPGLHLDVRSDRRPGDPATWGYLNGEWVSINDAIEWCED